MSGIEIEALLGIENGLKQEMLHKLKQKALKQAGALEVQRWYGHELESGALIGLLQSPSLFGDVAWVEVMMAEAIKKSELKSVVAFLKSQAGSGYVIFLSDEDKLDKTLEAIIPAKHKKVFKPLDEEELVAYAMQYLQEKEFSMEEPAIYLLLSRMESDSQVVKRMLDFLMQTHDASQPAIITSEQVRNYIDQVREFSVHDLFSAIAVRNIEQSMEIAEQLLHSKEGLSVMTLIVLQRSFKGVIDYKALLANGYSSQQALKELKIFYQRAESTKQAGKHFSHDELNAIMQGALSYDLAARDGNKELVKQVVLHFIISCCTTPFALYSI